MNIYGGACPFCCGDVDDPAFLESDAPVCHLCLDTGQAPQQSRSRWISPSHEIRIQTGASIARTESTTASHAGGQEILLQHLPGSFRKEWTW